MKSSINAKKIEKRAVSASRFDSLSMAELQDLKERVDRLINQKLSLQRSELLGTFKRMAEEAGFSLSELAGERRGKGKRPAARYVNPDNPAETWSGRGRKPNWLNAKLKAGVTQDDLKA